MQRNQETISRYQMLAMGFISLLSPIIRLLPQRVTAVSGAYGWLSIILATIPLSLLFLIMIRYFKYALPNEGFGELFIKSLGNFFGKLIIMLFTLWLIFYMAFDLRSVADRYTNSIFFNTSPATIIIIVLIPAVFSILGRFKNLGRTAESLLPFLALVLFLVIILSFADIDWLMLPSVKAAHLPTVLKSVPFAANVLSISIYVGFLEGRISQKKSRNKAVFIWLALITVIVSLLCAICVGCFGPKLSAHLNYLFFIMVRNISILNFIERLEALVLGVWVITDFVLISTLLFIIVNNLSLCFGYSPGSSENEKAFSLKKGRWIIWLCIAAVIPLSLIIVPDSQSLRNISQNIVPHINNAFTFGLLPLIMITGILRRKV